MEAGYASKFENNSKSVNQIIWKSKTEIGISVK